MLNLEAKHLLGNTKEPAWRRGRRYPWQWSGREAGDSLFPFLDLLLVSSKPLVLKRFRPGPTFWNGTRVGA